MEKMGVNREDQKKKNRGLILRLLATGQCTSRVELSRVTGLTKPAISQIVYQLISMDYLVETEKEVSEDLGRNPVGLDISPKAPKFVGVLIQRKYCEAVLCDMKLNCLKTRRIERSFAGRDELLDTVFELTDFCMEGEENICAIGVASIGPVRVRDGKIVRPFFFNNIQDIEIRKILEERYHLPVAFDHDNQSAVLAEQLFGNGKDYSDILLVGVAQGVGCGITRGRERVTSATGYAPEIGHISIDYKGIPCICGNRGCLERYIDSDAMLKEFREATGQDLTYAQFMEMTEDPRINAVMEDRIDKLVYGLVSTINILNSQLILLALDCCKWPDRYIAEIEERINQLKFGNKEEMIRVRKASFMEKSQVMGAACNAVNQIFLGEMLQV